MWAAGFVRLRSCCKLFAFSIDETFSGTYMEINALLNRIKEMRRRLASLRGYL